MLRAFLGVTFAFAGLQKLSSHSFLASHAAGSFQQQLLRAITTSPLHHLLSPATRAPLLVALLVSFGEVAVGLGTLLGLFGRIAAIGGMCMSLTFFLTVSFNDNPYYYGADIVFLFAWTPLVLGGARALSIDQVLARRAADARASLAELATRSPALARRRAPVLERRLFMERSTAVGLVATGSLALGGIVAVIGRLVPSAGPPRGSPGVATLGGPTPATRTTAASSTTTAPAPAATPGAAQGPAPKGTLIGSGDSVPVGGAGSFTDPSLNVPAFVVQPTKGRFLAFSAICTHAGCAVQFDQQQEAFVCPCHGSVFSAANGSVIQGPAPTGLQVIPIAIGPRGGLYVDG
jgi:thiosulfate dehydrogenase [quinone] large subunit